MSQRYTFALPFFPWQLLSFFFSSLASALLFNFISKWTLFSPPHDVFTFAAHTHTHTTHTKWQEHMYQAFCRCIHIRFNHRMCMQTAVAASNWLEVAINRFMNSINKCARAVWKWATIDAHNIERHSAENDNNCFDYTTSFTVRLLHR